MKYKLSMEKQPLTLKEKQSVFLGILKELDRFCNEHSIRYYMGCGTLIGAVRHKGFIPWDDDLDVFMPWPDYMRFCDLFKSDKLEMHTHKNDMSHPYTFGLLCTKDVYSVSNGRKRYNCGIDIYVIYGAPSDKEEQEKHKKTVINIICRKRKLVRLRSWLANRGLWISKSLKFSPINNLIRKAVREFEKYDYEKCEYIWPYGGGRLNLKKELYGNPVKLQFEDGYFWAPAHYHEVLKAAYGDYMTPPPEEKRHPIHNAVFYRDE